MYVNCCYCATIVFIVLSTVSKKRRRRRGDTKRSAAAYEHEIKVFFFVLCIWKPSSERRQAENPER